MRSDNMPRPFAPEHSEPDIVARLRGLWKNHTTTEDVRCADEAADEIERLREECDALGRANESVAVCAGHTSDITEGDCYVCRLAAASDEIERARFDIGEYQRNLDSEVAARLAAESELSKLRERVEKAPVGEVEESGWNDDHDKDGRVYDIPSTLVGKRVRLVVEDE